MPKFNFHFNKKKGKKGKKVKVSKAVKHYVQKSFDRMVEDKYFQITTPVNLTIANSDSALSSSVFLCPIVKGLDRNQRIGNSIRIKTIKIDAVFTTQGNEQDFNPTLYPNQTQIRWALSRFRGEGIILVSTPADAVYASGFGNSIWKYATADHVLDNQRDTDGYPNIRVLKQGTMVHQIQGGSLNVPQLTHKTIVHHFRSPLKLTFDSTNSVGAINVIKNSLFFHVLGCHRATGTVSSNCRLT